MIVFSKQWFKKYNKQLCWLANSFIGDFVFKVSKMGHDKKKYGKITEMHPNAITHFRGMFLNLEKHRLENKYTTQFFSRNEYALRLQKVFYPIWLLFHAWDMLIANPFKPAWNLGFDTLTVYPGDNGANDPVDGRVYRIADNVSWSSLRDDAGTGVAYTESASTIVYIGSGTISDWRIMLRGFFLFDTSALTNAATISASVLSIYGTIKTDGLSLGANHETNIYTSTPASNTSLASSDYSNTADVAQCDNGITYADYSTVSYNNWALNSTGKGNINKTGISKFATKFVFDATDTEQSRSGNNLTSTLSGYYSNNGSNKPKLVVTYTTLTHYSLVMGTGSFILTGKDVGLRAARKMTCEAGSFVLTGIDVGLNRGWTMICETGNFVLTGKNVSLRVARKLVCGTGSFVLTGADVGLHRSYKMVCEVGRFILTGIDVLLKRGIHNRSRVSTSFTNRAKNSTTLTNKSKNSTSFTNRAK